MGSTILGIPGLPGKPADGGSRREAVVAGRHRERHEWARKRTYTIDNEGAASAHKRHSQINLRQKSDLELDEATVGRCVSQDLACRRCCSKFRKVAYRSSADVIDSRRVAIVHRINSQLKQQFRPAHLTSSSKKLPQPAARPLRHRGPDLSARRRVRHLPGGERNAEAPGA